MGFNSGFKGLKSTFFSSAFRNRDKPAGLQCGCINTLRFVLCEKLLAGERRVRETSGAETSCVAARRSVVSFAFSDAQKRSGRIPDSLLVLYGWTQMHKTSAVEENTQHGLRTSSVLSRSFRPWGWSVFHCEECWLVLMSFLQTHISLPVFMN